MFDGWIFQDLLENMTKILVVLGFFYTVIRLLERHFAKINRG